ncbi:putative MFS family arabinose efflux permease [Aliiruegeria haliotis]|uniref:Putative MFS family arabinose efflux permease n=1 Tax=Aliiruegeria haliotis TaxID=1280846 RepID=A0A2T0RNA9_9RHOB|nr:MFS transporter [Aliiruegeria haliotis]PRY22686.1 putative MFS family arabinose efflux permease [Aliiruegeria haliotis]
MFQVISATWALLFGMLLLMVGNGVQGTLLGIRGGIEDFSTFEMSVVMSGYFLGFLGGSRLAPEMIRRVGHIRVFAALGSFVSAILILYPLVAHPVAWTAGRVLMGFCLSGVYVTAESWLNNAVTNERRGQALSLYVMVQMAGVVAAQGLLLAGDPSGFVLFVIPSVLVSISFAPILLAVQPTPAFDSTKPMSLRALWDVSQLGCVGFFLLGGVFSALFGMASVYGSEAGLSVPQISGFIASIYLGGMLMQYPIGWLSDRMDRRLLILASAIIGAVASLLAMTMADDFPTLLAAAFVIGGTSNPLYALLLAYVNDHLDYEDMAAASGGLIFINGIGAIMGPLITGWMMGVVGAQGFFLFLVLLCVTLAAYAAWRMTQSDAVPVDETGSYAPVLPTASPVAVEVAQEVFIEAAQEAEAEAEAEAQEQDNERQAEDTA